MSFTRAGIRPLLGSVLAPSRTALSSAPPHSFQLVTLNRCLHASARSCNRASSQTRSLLDQANVRATLRAHMLGRKANSPAVQQPAHRIRSLTTATLDTPHATDARAATGAPPTAEPRMTTPLVSKYLFVVAGMVFCIVIVGGMTRLTESGLSITEWNVVKGTLLPLSHDEWMSEFEKYKATPEWKINNQHITMTDFKKIYMWEWSHRMLGRLIGLTFLLPLPYFIYRRQLARTALAPLLGIATLIGGQGALGWYMVKSGLDSKSVEELGGVPRVSQYRLASHLGMAFCVFALCLRMGLGVKRDWQLVRLGKGLSGIQTPAESLRVLNGPVANRFRIGVTALSGLVFLTAFSGAFVAGLDAGLIYNEWPTMGDGLSPGMGELYKDYYARKADKSDKWWRNMFENPTTAQFDHRMLAYTTFTSVVTLFALSRRPSLRAHLPPLTQRLIKASLHMSVLQVVLGISTLLYLVPTHLAATHQAGSLVLLTLMLGVGASLRRPGKVAQEVMRIRAIQQKAARL
ncbi:Cox15p [Sporobolomyces koalae]|uniref:Cox15p n=1 Tax=Sporobolomyces koalae TaxID=500713 RepID=UPI00317E0C59